MQLQGSLPDLRNRGLGLAAVSYDSAATLKTFADARGITFPLLSDPGSETIKRYRILNAEASGRAAGIPYPGTFLLDARGIVKSRSFEARYQERASAGSIVARGDTAGAAGPTTETAHIMLTTSASDRKAALGTRVSLIVAIAPKPKMHVYAPGQTELIPVSLTLAADEAFTAHAAEYPPAENYYFAPLKETQRVYSKPFRIVQDVTIGLAPSLRERAAAGDTLTIAGTLRYQACDDKVCFSPQEVPVSWRIQLAPLAR